MKLENILRSNHVESQGGVYMKFQGQKFSMPRRYNCSMKKESVRYTRIRMDCLKVRLDLDEDEPESYLSQLVTQKMIYANESQAEKKRGTYRGNSCLLRARSCR